MIGNYGLMMAVAAPETDESNTVVAVIATVPESRAVANPVSESTVMREALPELQRNRTESMPEPQGGAMYAENRTVSPMLTVTDDGVTVGPINTSAVGQPNVSGCIMFFPHPAAATATTPTTTIERISVSVASGYEK
jgi:hypothetical protein